MGLYFHFVAQKKIDDKWIDIDDSYYAGKSHLFYLWFYHCNEVAPNLPRIHKGIPDDFELIEEFHSEHWMGDHCYGWIYSGNVVYEAMPHGYSSDIPNFLEIVTDLHEKHGEVRIVFGFD